MGYGDYGVVHPVPPRTGPSRTRPVPPDPYFFYSTPSTYLFRTRAVRRGASRWPVRYDDLGDAYGQLARELLVRRPAGAVTDSWGDDRLRAYAGGTARSNDATDWIAASMSHHLAQLASAAGPTSGG